MDLTNNRYSNQHRNARGLDPRVLAEADRLKDKMMQELKSLQQDLASVDAGYSTSDQNLIKFVERLKKASQSVSGAVQAARSHLSL